MPIIQQIINNQPTIIGQPGTDLSTIDFSDAIGPVNYRVHLSSVKAENIRFPSTIMDTSVGLNFTLRPNHYLTVWTNFPFYASTDTDASLINYWEPGYGEAPISVSPGSTLPNPYDVNLLSEADAGPTSASGTGISYTPITDTDLVTVEALIATFGTPGPTPTSLEIRQGTDTGGPILFTSDPQNMTDVKQAISFDVLGSPRLLAGQPYTLTLTLGAAAISLFIEEGLNASSEIGLVNAGNSITVNDVKVRLVGTSADPS